MPAGRIGRAVVPLAPLALALATACSRVGAGADGGRTNAFTQPHVLRWADAQDVHGLNPHIVAEANVSYLSELTMAYLARYDRRARPVPELATAIPTQGNGGISPDGKTITWHLRSGVRWSDGAPFDADDVVFSIAAVLNPKNDEIGRDGWVLIAKVDEPDKRTVVMHLRRPYSSYVPTFFTTGGANPCILPKHILGKLADINTAPYNALPVGIGPFRYREWARGDHIALERNPYYWRGRAKLDRIVFEIVPDANTVLAQQQSGDLDLWSDVRAGFVERIGALHGFRVVRLPSSFYDHLDFNTQRPVTGDPIVRQALRYATDRPTLLAKASHGVGILTDSVVTTITPVYDRKLSTIVPFDLARANALLDGDGWKRGADGVRVKNGRRLALEIALTSGAPDIDTRLELIRASWARAGAAVSIKHYLPSVLFAPYADDGPLYRGRFDAITFAWGGDVTGNVSTQYSCAQIPPNGQNDSRYWNHVADAAMERFKLQYDRVRARADANVVQETIARDAPVIVLDDREDLFSVNADVRGFEPASATPFDDFMNVDI